MHLQLILCASHFLGCAWARVGVEGARAGEGWLMDSAPQWGNSTQPGWDEQQRVREPQLKRELYTEALYWAVVTVSTVGYGDVHPTTMHEQRVAVVMIVLVRPVLGSWGNTMRGCGWK